MEKGDKLKVKMGLEHNKKYGENCYRNGMFKGGEIVTLKEYKEDGGWCVKEDSRWRYTPEMLEPINKNYLHEAVKSFMADNGLEIGEEFRIKDASEECLYFINDKYILQYRNRQATGISVNEIQELLTGELELIKILWKPTGEYFYNTMSGVFVNDMNNQYSINYFNMQHQNYYKTTAEAEADRPRMLKIFKEIQDEFNKL